jgi:hypothetical protein
LRKPLAAAALLGAGFQHYCELRERAFSPAVAEAKYQALQSRIRPHFLFNSLNAVLSVIRSEPAKAERMLESIAELFRAVMADTRRLVPLAQEIELCRNYVEIEQTRLGNRLAVDWQIGAYHPRAKVPQLLLQPVIENAIRYGAEKDRGSRRNRGAGQAAWFRARDLCQQSDRARAPRARGQPDRAGQHPGSPGVDLRSGGEDRDAGAA